MSNKMGQTPWAFITQPFSQHSQAVVRAGQRPEGVASQLGLAPPTPSPGAWYLALTPMLEGLHPLGSTQQEQKCRKEVFHSCSVPPSHRQTDLVFKSQGLSLSPLFCQLGHL